MGFDAVDKRFQPRRVIKLECAHCHTTTSDVAKRTAYKWLNEVSAPLCNDCYKLSVQMSTLCPPWDKIWQ